MCGFFYLKVNQVRQNGQFCFCPPRTSGALKYTSKTLLHLNRYKNWGYTDSTIVPLAPFDSLQTMANRLPTHANIAATFEQAHLIGATLQFCTSLKKLRSKALNNKNNEKKITMCFCLLFFSPAHTTKKNKTRLFILWHCAYATSTQCSMRQSLSFLTHPYTHTHTHTHMLTDKHKIYMYTTKPNSRQVAQSPLALQSTSNGNGKFCREREKKKELEKVTARGS